MNEKYEPIKFDSWQELAKYVIDGGEVYFKAFQNKYLKITFNGTQFDTNIDILHKDRELFTKKQLNYKNKKFLKVIVNIDEHGFFIDDSGCTYDNAQMLTDDEIKQFLGGE